MPSASGLLVLMLMTGLGVVGFIDDFIKIYKQRSLGLRSSAKLAGPGGGGRGVRRAGGAAALRRRIRHHARGRRTCRSCGTSAPPSGWRPFVLWIVIMIAGTSNAVNLTDGLDGLATGSRVPGAAPPTC